MLLCAQTIIEDPLMRHSAVLVYANKQDMVSPAVQQISVHRYVDADLVTCKLNINLSDCLRMLI